ncbi:hypothetical protein SAMN05216431_1045 [Ligilactobacillus sp. WC1T17]|uniref:Uncharacterized protein n=1 Tax=Ligilactobacillus ruminis TaxID=1623 RepID=A0ABY1AAH1_9LACO|nr:hypothetical protein SAMN05216431_1045 [Ligilactobacillus ruminis]
MAKTFVDTLKDNVIEENSKFTAFQVPSKRENLILQIDNDLLFKLSAHTDKLEKMLHTLLRNHSAKNEREIININKHNYKIFL